MPDIDTAPETDLPVADKTNKTGKSVGPDNTAIAKVFYDRVEASEKNIKKRSPEWKRSVEQRMGRITGRITEGVTSADEVLTEVNPDWALTKTKTANLYSQVPTVRGTHEGAQYAPAVAPFLKALNYEIGEKRANVGVAMEEVLNDVVNAAGIGAVYVGYAARFEKKDVPVEQFIQTPRGPLPTAGIPPEYFPQLQQAGLLRVQPTDSLVDYKFFISRMSPTDLLTPAEFVGSNFDDGDFVGRRGKYSWAVAKVEFKLTNEDKELVCSDENNPEDRNLAVDPERQTQFDVKNVLYREIYYWRYRVDPDEKSFSAIWRIVWVKGKDTPVIHEKWTGQQYNAQTRKYVGSCKFPIRVLTLTYITDNPIPPSDSQAGRPQVNDMRRSRSQMFANRERSIPIRGYDVNRVDPLVAESLMRGTWQGFIPINGNGERAIWEVARASYPSEDISFDQQTKKDLQETWQIGDQQMGTGGASSGSATGDQITQQNFSTRIGQERNKVASFFLTICEVLAGLMVLHSDFPTLSDQERQAMQQAWDQKSILHDLVLKILPDSTIVLDAQQEISRIANFLNLTVKSGFVNPMPLITKMAELSGLDPSEVIVQPQPKPADDPNISYRFSGSKDIQNPIVLAAFLKRYDISADELDKAKKLLLDNLQPPQAAPPGAPGGPQGPSAPPPPGAGGPDVAGPAPTGEPAPGEDMRPEWSLGNRVAKRSDELQGE